MVRQPDFSVGGFAVGQSPNGKRPGVRFGTGGCGEADSVDESSSRQDARYRSKRRRINAGRKCDLVTDRIRGHVLSVQCQLQKDLACGIEEGRVIRFVLLEGEKLLYLAGGRFAFRICGTYHSLTNVWKTSGHPAKRGRMFSFLGCYGTNAIFSSLTASQRAMISASIFASSSLSGFFSM